LGDRLPAQAGLMVGHMWYVYILKSSIKKWYYVGSTNRLQQRLKEHNEGKVLSTKAYKPLEFVFKKRFKLESEARGYERLLKDKRKEKEKIISLIESS
jgi:putative endonuclease